MQESTELSLKTIEPLPIYASLERFAREKITELCSSQVCFAFIFGCFDKNIDSLDQGFGVFICLHERDTSLERLLKTVLIKAQIAYGVLPDDAYTIEIMSKKELDESLNQADEQTVGLESTDDSFSRWSQLIADRKILIYGEPTLFHTYETRCGMHQLTWKEHLLQELQKKDALFLLNRVVHFHHRNSYEAQRRQKDHSLMLAYHFDIDMVQLSKIVLSYVLNQMDQVLEHLEKQYPETIPDHAKVMLDGADGGFETYKPIGQTYHQTTSDIRRYIPFDSQYTFQNSSRDRRATLMHFLIQTGIAHAGAVNDVESIVTGLGSGYILNKTIQLLNNNKGHGFIIPVPTYGYFIPAIAACGAVPIFVDTTGYDRFALPPDALEQIILKNNSDLYKNHIKAFIQSFTQFIQGLKSEGVLSEEIEQRVILSGKESKIHVQALSFQNYLVENYAALKIKYPKLPESILTDFPELPRVKCLFFINPHNPLGIIYSQDYVDSIAVIASKYHLTIIDDLTHMEVMFSKDAHIGFFNKALYPVDVVTLISPSKALCMAECRVGFALINNKILVEAYKELVFNDGLFLSRKQLSALEYAFVLNDERAQYLANNAAEYKQRMEMVQYIFHPELRGDLSPESHTNILQLFEFYALDIDLYKEGVPGIQLLNPKPESGLFCVLDFTSIQGQYFLNTQINTNKDLWSLLRILNMYTLTGEHLYYTDRLVIRFPICEPPLLILTAIKRLKNMMSQITCSPVIEQGPKSMTTASSPNTITVVERTLPNERSVNEIDASVQALIHIITDKSDRLREILAVYQPQSVTDYEIERSIRTLRGTNLQDLWTPKTMDTVAVMLPSNLPLYSLVIFVIIPSFLCKHVYVRPNSILQQYDIISCLYDELQLSTLCAGVAIINQDHEGFSTYIRDAELVVYTGKPSNAEKLHACMKEGSLMVLNGAGHNPLVITDSANIDDAVDGALLVKGFNGGQDCAGPDAILVHHSVANEFISKFQQKFQQLPIGNHQDPNTMIGPIHRFTELQRFSEVFHTHRSDILSGGVIDFKAGIVFPTIIVRAIERRPNYKEMYGPVAFIHPYKTDDDLALYFEDSEGLYQSNRMYVSVYGQSPYLKQRDDKVSPGEAGNVGIVLRDQTIHEVEIGYLPYGGYSLGASALIRKLPGKKVERVAMPILLPDIIQTYVIQGNPFPLKKNVSKAHQVLFFTPTTRIIKEMDPIIVSFRQLASTIFQDNLVFGFVFGSASKGALKIKGPDSDDLDTFICLKKADSRASNDYLEQLSLLHAQYHLKVDTTFPAEIMTLETLSDVLSHLHEINVSVDELITGETFDHIFWTHALTDKKMGFLGNSEAMFHLIKRGSPHILRWSKQIVGQLLAKETLPEYLRERFPGLHKDQAIAKLKSYSPHVIVHLGLQYDTEATPALAKVVC